MNTRSNPVDAYYAAQSFGYKPDDGPVDDDDDFELFLDAEDILEAGRALPAWLHERRHARHQERVAAVVIHFACDVGARLSRNNLSEADRISLIRVCGDVFASLVSMGRSAGVSAITFWDSVLAIGAPEKLSLADRHGLEAVISDLIPICRPTSARIGMIDGLALLGDLWAEPLVEAVRTQHPRKAEVDHAARFAVPRIRAGGWSNFRALPGEAGAGRL